MVSLDKLKIGDKAPEIAGHSINMGDFKLSDAKGGQRVFVVFSRYFGCSLCQPDFKELLEKASEIEKRGKMVYINQSNEETASKFLSDKAVTFPVILDSKEPYPFYQAYGIGNFSPLDMPRIMERVAKARSKGLQHGSYEGNEKQSPADFIVSREGTIDYAHYGPLDLDKAMQVWFRE